MQPEILYQDRHIAVVVKPAGVLSESPGMPELLRDSLGGDFFCVHRLDAGVGGVMVYARTGQAAGRLSAAVAQRSLTKEYLAVVQGRPAKDRGVLRDLLFHDKRNNKTYVVDRMRKGVKEAELEYTVIGCVDDISLHRPLPPDQGAVCLPGSALAGGRPLRQQNQELRHSPLVGEIVLSSPHHRKNPGFPAGSSGDFPLDGISCQFFCRITTEKGQTRRALLVLFY